MLNVHCTVHPRVQRCLPLQQKYFKSTICEDYNVFLYIRVFLNHLYTLAVNFSQNMFYFIMVSIIILQWTLMLKVLLKGLI